jgi:hypothetical protein
MCQPSISILARVLGNFLMARSQALDITKPTDRFLRWWVRVVNSLSQSG